MDPQQEALHLRSAWDGAVRSDAGAPHPRVAWLPLGPDALVLPGLAVRWFHPRKTQILRSIAAGGLLCMIAAICVQALVPPASPVITALMFVSALTAAATFLASFYVAQTPWRGAHVVVVKGQLVVDHGERRTSAPLAHVAQGWAQSGGVEVHFANGSVAQIAVSYADGQRLLAALAIDAASRTMDVTLGKSQLGAGGWTAIALILLPATFVLFNQTSIPTWLAAIFALLATFLGAQLLRLFFHPHRLIVGSDGVLIDRIWSRVFIPAADITRIDIGERDFVFHRPGGAPVRARTRALDPTHGEQIKNRLAEIYALADTRGGSATLGHLDRGARPLSEWIASLRSLLGRDSGYRAAKIVVEDLLQLLCNPAAPPDRRIGAAIALRGSETPNAEAKIRVAATSCADARLRIALEHIAEGDLEADAIAEALNEKSQKMA